MRWSLTNEWTGHYYCNWATKLEGRRPRKANASASEQVKPKARKNGLATAEFDPSHEEPVLGPSTFDETDADSDSESKALFGPHPELITWDLDKQKKTSLLDNGSTVFQSNMSLLL